MFRDLRYAVRGLLRQPGFTLVAVLSLGLGIGLNTTMFSVVNAVLLKDLPVRDPERLVEIYTNLSEEMPYLTSSYPDYEDLRQGTDVFEGLLAHANARGILYRDGRSELVMGEVVTSNYFDVLGVKPQLGRGFAREEDEVEGAHPVAVVSHGLWQRRLGGAENVVGSTIRISGLEYTVIGVAPEAFSGTIPGLAPEFWTPTAMVDKLRFSGIQADSPSPSGNTRRERRGTRWLFLKGRLAPGRTADEAQAQVTTVMARLASDHPDTNEDVKALVLPGGGVRFHPMIDSVLNQASAALLIAVGLVLVIACANVANMLLARAQNRSREIAVRLSVGASRGQLLKQLMTESFVLAGLGAAFGLLLAYAGGRLLSAFQPPLPIPVSFTFELDATVVGYALLVSIATALLFGLAPGWKATKPNLVPSLKGDSRGYESGRSRERLLSKALVAGQLALSLVLLVAGTLLTRGLFEARRLDVGFDPERIAEVSFDLGMNNYTFERAQAFQREALETLRSLPGVEAVSLGTRMPLAPDIQMEGVQIPGLHEPGDDGVPIDMTRVGPDYFRVVGVPVRQGRVFDEGDREGAPGVVVINEAMAERFWPGESPVGKRIHTDSLEDAGYEIVGVVGDHKVRSVNEEPRPYLHFPIAQSPSTSTTFLVRTSGNAEIALPALERAVQAMDPEIVLMESSTAAEVANVTLTPTRLGASLLGAFGVLALMLAAVGLYGVIAYSVSRRTREVGLRMAMGARGSDVLRLILGQGMRLAWVGIALGAVLSLALGRVLSSLLYGVSAHDPLAYGIAVVVLAVVAGVANFVPAWRASRVSPMTALRYE